MITMSLVFMLSACELTVGRQDEHYDNGNGELPVDLTTPRTDALSLSVEDYAGKSFISDGIGEVSLDLCIDGDTARFNESGISFSVRFLGVDTPESTGRVEPWGRAASDFTCDKLENAETIVLQADPNRERFDSTGNRYLGYVWYDGRLLNLELIEMAFSNAIGSIGLIYGVEMYDAWVDTQPTRRHIHGERDPNFDYEAIETLVSIEELVTNTEAYMGRFVTVEGVITRTEGGHPWLQQGDYGIYLYSGFEFTTQLVIGNEVRISRLQLAYWPDQFTGALQLTNFRRTNMTILSRDNVVEPSVISLEELDEDQIGSFIKLENLTLMDSRNGNQFTIRAQDEHGNIVHLRKNSSSNFSFPTGVLTAGKQINISGPVHVFNGQIQVVITRLDDVEILD